LTFDYQFERFGGKKQRCYCNEPNCRGFLGEKPKHIRQAKEEIQQEIVQRYLEPPLRLANEEFSTVRILQMNVSEQIQRLFLVETAQSSSMVSSQFQGHSFGGQCAKFKRKPNDSYSEKVSQHYICRIPSGYCCRYESLAGPNCQQENVYSPIFLLHRRFLQRNIRKNKRRLLRLYQELMADEIIQNIQKKNFEEGFS